MVGRAHMPASVWCTRHARCIAFVGRSSSDDDNDDDCDDAADDAAADDDDYKCHRDCGVDA